MESLIPNSALFVFFFALIAIFDYSDLSLEQRISIIYISVYAMIAGIFKTLRQKYSINTFTKIYETFSIYYIKSERYYKAKNTKQFNDACEILTNIEDRTYFTRKAYTCASPAFVFSSIKAVWKTNSLKYAIKHGTKLVSDVIATKRGFSTIQMQLIRTLGLADGYECTFRRKIYEILYARMFFSQLRRYYKNEFVKYDEPFKKYLLYVYFHSVNLWLGKAYFKRFLNPFNMNKEGTQKDIQDCSNEGIFIACMGLSRRASKINENNIDYYLNEFKSDVRIDRDKVLEMVSSMSEAPYDGNYLE